MTNGKSSSDRRVTVSPLLLVLGAAILWSTGGLFIKATSLSAFELSFGRSLLAAITIAIVTRREGFGLNRVSAITSILYAALLLLFVLATKLTTAANAIFLQYTAPARSDYRGRVRRRHDVVFRGQAAAAGRERKPSGPGVRSVLCAFLFAAAALKSAQRQPRFVGDLWQPDRGFDLRAGVLWRGPARDQRRRSRAHQLSRHRPDWLCLFAFHIGDGARPALAGREHRRLYRAGAESCLGVPFHRRAALGLGDYWRRDHHRIGACAYVGDREREEFASGDCRIVSWL